MPRPKNPNADPQRVLQGQLSAAIVGSRRTPAQRRELTTPARAAFYARFEREVDPDGTLDPVERAFRAAHARRAYMLRLAVASARVRREKARLRAAEAELVAGVAALDGGA